MAFVKRTIEQEIADLEKNGFLDPNCETCKEVFYPQLKVGMSFSLIFAPRHKPSRYCESGKEPHCTCDSCF